MPDTSAKVILGCSQCGETLPDGARYCLKCGKPVAVSPQYAPVATAPAASTNQKIRKKRPLLRWTFLLLLLAAILWVVSSDNPFAQGIQAFAGWKHDQSVLSEPFTVSAHNLRYYKFSLPEGSTNVAIVGEFTAAPASAEVPNTPPPSYPDDSNIEVYVLSEAAFAVWQRGYAASSVYESGRVSQGKAQADLPAGAGIYYLVFNNRFSAKTPKSVTASFSLHYKSWLPEWFRRTKGRLWNWLGL